MTIEEALAIIDRYLHCNTGNENECQSMVRCVDCKYDYSYKEFKLALRVIKRWCEQKMKGE